MNAGSTLDSLECHWATRRRYRASILAAVGALMAFMLLVGVSCGAESLTWSEVYRSVLDWVTVLPAENREPRSSIIVFELRLPRVIAMALTGAALASAGAAYQGLFRNSLADPYVIGIAAGCGLGAIAVISWFPSTGDFSQLVWVPVEFL